MVDISVIIHNRNRCITFIDAPPPKGFWNFPKKGVADLVKEDWEHGLYYKIELHFNFNFI